MKLIVKILLCLFFTRYGIYVFAQSDTVSAKKFSIELSTSSLGIITNNYDNGDLQALGGSFISANFGINQNKHKYSGGIIFQLPGFLGYNTTKIGGSFCYQYFPNPKRKFDLYLFSELKYIYSTYSGTWYLVNGFPPPNSYAEIVDQKFNTVNMAVGYGFYFKVLRSFYIGTDIEAGAGFFSYKDNRNVPDYPQWSSSYNSGMFKNKHFSLGAKLSLMYNFN